MLFRSTDVNLYLLTAAVPVFLLALFSLFRWRYLRVVRRAIYAGAPASDSSSDASPHGLPRQPLVLVSEYPVEGRIPAGPELLVAQREEAAYRTALALAGLLFVVLAALIIWRGRGYLGTRAAVSLAYWCTLPGILLVVVFARRAWSTAIGSVIVWLTAGFLVHLVFLGISVGNTLALFPGLVGLVGAPTLGVGLLALRATRPVLVGLVPMAFVWLVTTIVLAAALDAAGVNPASGFTPRAVAAGLTAAVLGTGLAIRQIRRGLSRGSVVLLIGLTLAGVLAGRLSGISWVSGIATGVGFNGLLTMATWWLFARFVRFKAKGHLPDEVLHYGFGWLGLAVLLPNYADPLAWQWSLLPLVAFGTTLQQLLRRLRLRAHTRAPRRLLLLRAFNESRLRSDLLDALDASWRRIGTLDLVVGGDLAVRTVSGPVLESVLLGTVHRHFIQHLDEVDDRLARLTRRAALDGRFPLNEVHCQPAVWQAVVTALADEADVVLMDLRGMRARNSGALFELRMAVQHVELSRIVLLADARTDERALTEVAEEGWRALPDSFPNRVDPDPRLVVLRCSGRVARDNVWIIERVFAADGHGSRRLSHGAGGPRVV